MYKKTGKPLLSLRKLWRQSLAPTQLSILLHSLFSQGEHDERAHCIAATSAGMSCTPDHPTQEKSRSLNEVFALKHSHLPLTPTVTRLSAQGNKTVHQDRNHMLLSTVVETLAVTPAINSTLSDQHFVWQMLTAKCLKNHCNECLPSPESQSAQTPAAPATAAGPNNSQLSAFT